MTKEEMLRLLTAAYTGPGSAAEGTFAGDVLRACADGMRKTIPGKPAIPDKNWRSIQILLQMENRSFSPTPLARILMHFMRPLMIRNPAARLH